MASTMRYASGKEVGAVIFNVKEQKYLQKSMHTLDIEQNYSLKLLELDHRVLRVNHQKLKDRVNRIKSNLTADDIIELRQLEEKGQLKPSSNGVNIGSAMKIAAASRRLNLNGTRHLARSAPVSRHRARLSEENLEVRDKGDSAKTKIIPSVSVIEPLISERGLHDRSSHSASGSPGEGREDICSPNVRSSPRKPASPATPKSDNKPGSDEVEEGNSEAPPNLNQATKCDSHKHTHSLSARDGVDSTNGKHLRPVTTATNCHPRRSLTSRRPQTHHGTSQTNAPFSSHSVLEKDQRQATPRDQLLRKRSSIVDDSMESNFGENLYEERRMNMLRMETIHAVVLAKKKEAFLQDMEEFIDESKNVTFSKQNSIDLEDGGGGKRINSASRRSVDFDFLHQTGDIYKARLLNLWKGLNKCRYLRVPDHVLDLSGIKTLARDQFQLNSLWQNYNQTPH